jgi:hypothetical protein
MPATKKIAAKNQLRTVRQATGVAVSGLEADGADAFYCGGGADGKVRVVRNPKP